MSMSEISTGSVPDIVARMKSVLPSRWFADSAPVLDGVLTGLSATWAMLYTLLQSIRAQGRIATASGIFLDIAAQDYFGGALVRRAGEADPAFSARIRANLLAPKATRGALEAAISNLTGRTPQIFEPANPSDTGGYGTNTLGYGVCGGYGSLNLPYQVFVMAFRPDATQISHTGGYNTGPGGYNTAPLCYIDNSENTGAVDDAEIYSVIAATLPANAIAWTRLSN